jgi:hypothetical protein
MLAIIQHSELPFKVKERKWTSEEGACFSNFQESYLWENVDKDV